MISRRGFHRSLAGLAGTLAGAPAAHGWAARFAGRFIDVHTHLGQTWNTDEPLSAEVDAPPETA